MDFDYTEFQQMLLDSANKVVADWSGVERWRAHRELPHGVSAETWKLFADLGWLALPLPDDAGGVGGSMEDVALLMTALGRGLVIEPIVSTSILCAFILERGLEGEMRESLLAQVVAGSLRLALAHDEGAERYGETRPRSVMARRDGHGFVLNGAKTFVLDGPSAHSLIVSARIEGEGGTSLYLVPADTPGIRRGSYPLIDGSQACDLWLEEATVPFSALIAQGSRGDDLLFEALDRATVALLAQAVGSMEASVDVCSQYMKERLQFGQPISNFQSLQHLAVDMLVATHQARSALYCALAHLESSPDQRARAVSIAKIVGGEASQIVSRIGIQLHGGYGMTDEFAIGHHFRRLMAIEKSYGDVDHHLRRLSQLPSTRKAA